ncbi:VCBS repeat-containing protein [Aureitalea marina]|uniref:VCBS repeat-containing protein n=1 Tax=Aureitalea marina TaxID=930804 RepID=UPI000CF27974|nr:VCBS repeat-containing protein [Aureitalea marina]
MLYINNGDLTFTESAEQYGLNDQGISTQSVFFDMDKDGDLDCFVSNENEFYGLDPLRFFNQMEVRPADLEKSSVQMYRNDGNSFTRITKEAGMLTPSFGLGVTAGDVNQDGWIDVYVANDYYVPDALFINQGKGTFANRIKDHIRQITFFGMGVDMADINNDGNQDIYVLDMASSDHVRSKTLMASMDTKRFSLLVDRFEMPYQYMFNSLQLNVGNDQFVNIAQHAKVAKTDWSWAGLMTDFDLDGLKDIYVTNGYRRYALDNDSRIMVTQAKQAYQGNVPVEVKQRLYDALPSEKLSNILYQNTEGLEFKNKTAKWGFLEPSFSNGASYADLDNDGDLDLVINNIDEPAFIYQNLSVDREVGNYLKVVTKGKTSEPFARVELFYDGRTQLIETKRVKGYLSATTPDAHFGLGDVQVVDTVRVTWPNGKMEERYAVDVNSSLTFKEEEAFADSNINSGSNTAFKQVAVRGMSFDHLENDFDDFVDEILLPYKQSTFGPYMAKADINGDGKEDLWIGGATGQAGAVFVQSDSGFRKLRSTVLQEDSGHEDMEAVWFDADGDSDMDLYVVSGGNEFPASDPLYKDRLYINDGSGGLTKAAVSLLPAGLAESGKTVTAFDMDGDGDKDLVVGNRITPGQYPMAATSFILRNDAGQFSLATAEMAPEFSTFGIVNKTIATDFDQDGQMDFMAVAEWGGVGFFKNQGGVFENIAAQYDLADKLGWWFHVGETDVNNDGLPDYVLGNMGSNIKFKASADKPFRVYGNDFDGNGTFDLVLSKKYNGKDVPVRGRECSSQQMPFITEKFSTYNEFANASLQDIYGEELNSAYQAEMNTLKSVVLINTGSGFEIRELPPEAQLFPVFASISTDINKDGYQDIVLAGNIFNTEVETPRMDMGLGLVLLGGETGYRSMKWEDAGLYLDGNVKSLEFIPELQLLIAGTNNGSLQLRQLP